MARSGSSAPTDIHSARSSVPGSIQAIKPVPPADEPFDDPVFLGRSLGFFNWMFKHYFRVAVIGLEHLPAGPSLLVSNHGGFIPWDGAMIHTAIWRATGRHPRFLVTSWAFTVKGLGGFLRRTGNVPASPQEAARLLARGDIVGTFPEGVDGVAKPIWHRYRPERFREGFARLGLKEQVPIVPISVVGSEDSYPIVANWAWLGRKLGGEALPITLFWPLLGPMGLIPLPVKWIIQVHAPVNVPVAPPASSLDRGMVSSLARQVERTIDEGVHASLRRRRGPFS